MSAQGRAGGHSRAGRLLLPALAVVLGLLTGRSAWAEAPFPALYPDPELFLAAMAGHPAAPLSRPVTGLTVPHHLLAADLIAGAFARLSTQAYRRIVILAPDHYSRSATPFAVADRDFDTCLGPVRADTEAAARLLACPLVSASSLFAHEHGVQALTPFIARYFPDARILAVAIHKKAAPEQWDVLAKALAPLLDAAALVIQSTDFSHYLPPAEAARRDQQTLRLLADPDPGKLAALNQPGHVDSRAALYLQRRLQASVFQAEPVTVANRNSQAYSRTPVRRSTSYMVQYYGPQPLGLAVPNRFYFAGDAFFGRGLAALLARPDKRRELVRLVKEATGGAPLIVNLEGVLRRRCPARPGRYRLCMPTAHTLALLRQLNVRAVSLANNHARDFGGRALARMRRALGRAGIGVVGNGEVLDLGRFRLAGLSDLDNADPRRAGLLTPAAVRRLARFHGGKHLFVMAHWGREFADGPGEGEHALADGLVASGAQLVLGAHPHRAWPLSCNKDACLAWSLGNFLFDQGRAEADGALVEVAFFPQGTYAVRRIGLGNLFSRLKESSGRPACPESAGDL